jgi:K+-sensing histidine kinase KdpD
MIMISVIDSGIGIHQDNQDKLFQLFGSIKNEKQGINTQGVGLGLVICKLIVEKFEGKIDFISKYNTGSTFFFSIKIDEIESVDFNNYNEIIP